MSEIKACFHFRIDDVVYAYSMSFLWYNEPETKRKQTLTNKHVPGIYQTYF